VSDIEFHTPFLNDYLKMVEETESPRLFHIWAALSGISACLGRRCWFPFGPMTIFPNQYIALIGTPGTRKSTAMSIMKNCLRKSTGVRFAPVDTAGQRQGLVEAMRGKVDSEEYLDNVELAANENSLAGLTLDQVARITNVRDETGDDSDIHEEARAFISGADKHHIMVTATELSRFIGQNNFQMLDFLGTMWDGEDYEYQTKAGLTVLRDPLINLLSCTTPTSLNVAMPPAAGGQGFLSRMILVYGSRKYKSVPRPTAPDAETVLAVKGQFNRTYLECAGMFEETPDAKEYCESLYEWKLEINDPRFGYYHERRQDHLIKLGMALAASRTDTTIVKDDYETAHRILRATERGMPDALGEFGMNPLAALKQNMLEYIRSRGAVKVEDLRAVFHRDSRASDFMEACNDLSKLNQVSMAQLANGSAVLMARGGSHNSEDEMLKALLA
jgi:hypothetical protein